MLSSLTALGYGKTTVVTVTPHYGADGPGATHLALTESDGDSFSGRATNLFDTATGNRIFLYTDSSGVLLGRVGNDSGTSSHSDNASGAISFALKLADDGSLTIAEYRAIKHPVAESGDGIHDSDDIVSLLSSGGSGLVYVTATSTDFDGDSATRTSSTALTIKIDDDGPRFSAAVASASVDEDGGLTGGNAGGTGDNPTATTMISSQSLNIDWGVDNTDTNDSGGKQDGAITGSGFTTDTSVLTGRAVYFSNNIVSVTASAAGFTGPLTSRGEQVDFKLDDSGTTLLGVGHSSGRAVFTVHLSDDGSGSYSFTLQDVLDHPTGGTEDDINLKFNFTARDADGDTASSNFTVIVNDDTPVVLAATKILTAVDEDDLSNGNGSPHDTPSLTTSAGLGVQWGADNDLVSATDPHGRKLAFAVNGLPAGLTSDGLAVDYSSSTSASGVVTVIAYKHNGNPAAAADQVFIVTLDPTTSDGKATFQLVGNLDHPSGNDGEAAKTLTFSYQATDSDGDTAAQTGTFSVSVADDVPTFTAANVVNGSVDEEGLTGGNPGSPTRRAICRRRHDRDGRICSGGRQQRRPANRRPRSAYHRRGGGPRRQMRR